MPRISRVLLRARRFIDICLIDQKSYATLKNQLELVFSHVNNREKELFMNRIILPCSGLYQRDGSHLLVSDGNAFQILRNCQGYYRCPVDANGIPIGPIVGYTKEYAPGLHWVGLEYYNFSKADVWPAVLNYFASVMADKLQEAGVLPDVIIGAPWAGVKFSQEVSRLVGCRHIFAEKQEGGRLSIGRYEGIIRSGDSVVIGEELVNNASTTGNLIGLVEEAGGKVRGIICAINRSFPFKAEFLISDTERVPIFGVIERERPQYQQNHPLVAAKVAADEVIWKPKYHWEQMEQAMGDGNADCP